MSKFMKLKVGRYFLDEQANKIKIVSRKDEIYTGDNKRLYFQNGEHCLYDSIDKFYYTDFKQHNLVREFTIYGNVEKPFTKESLSVTKPIPGAMSSALIMETSKVLAFGAEKYDRDNWRKCKPEQMDLYWDALFRHLHSYRLGEKNDQETDLSHLAHANCNLMFLFELLENKGEKE